MSVKLSSLLAARERRTGSFSVKAVDLRAVGDLGSPVLVLDDFRVQGSPFEPHPHAGFSAVTYVFEDSPGRLRSRDSLGHDVEIGPGGIVWTQAGRGVIHHEVPADFRHELHGLQLFVNLSARNKHLAPQMLSLGSHDVPVWQGDEGNRVRVVAGSYAGVTSPLVPPEPFDFLDVALRRRIAYDLPAGNCAIVYVAAGEVRNSCRRSGTHRRGGAGHRPARRRRARDLHGCLACAVRRPVRCRDPRTRADAWTIHHERPVADRGSRGALPGGRHGTLGAACRGCSRVSGTAPERMAHAMYRPARWLVSSSHRLVH